MIPFILFFLYLVLGILTITHYGINWDEPAHFMRGQAFLRFLINQKKDYSGIPEIDLHSYKKDFGYELKDATSGGTIRRSIYQHQERPLMFYTEDIEKRGTHPALSDVLAALSNYIFFIKLGIAPDIFSYNYYAVFIAAMLVTVLFVWVRKHFGGFTALVAALSLASYPVFWAESHNNIKDVPEAAFFSFAIFSFYEAVTTRKIKYTWLFALSCGLAFATKFNLLFLFPIVFLWLIVRYFASHGMRWFHSMQFFKQHMAFVLAFSLVPLAMIIFWVGTFPAAWFEPKLLVASFSYYKTIGTSTAQHFTAYPLYYLFFTTPVIILFYSAFCVLSIFSAGAKKEKEVTLLVLIWFFLPIVRVMLPHTSIYGGVRQIMEYVPAMAILSGIGAGQLARWFESRIASRQERKQESKKGWNSQVITLLPKLVLLFCFFPITLKLISLHPNEGVYFNQLIGGLKGAKEQDIPDWGQTLGNPHRQGIGWINKHVEQNARLSLDFELWANLPHIWVRNDIYNDSRLKTGPLREGEYVMSVTNPSDFLSWYRFRVYDVFLDPVHEVLVDGVPLLKIWKNDKEHIKKEYKNIDEEKISGVPVTYKKTSLTVTLPQTRRLLRIEYKTDDPKLCEGLPETIGTFQLYELEGKQSGAIPASTYDFNGRVIYNRPFFLFAADPAKVVVLNIAGDYTCYSTIKRADVFVIKE